MSDICQERSIGQPTFYVWKSNFGCMDADQIKRIKELEAELSQNKKIVAEQSLRITLLKNVIEKKF